MSSRKRKAGEEEELVSLPSGDEESEEDAQGAPLWLRSRYGMRFRGALLEAMRRPQLRPPVNLVIHKSLARNCAMTCTMATPPLRVVALRIDQRKSGSGEHAVAPGFRPGLLCLAQVGLAGGLCHPGAHRTPHHSARVIEASANIPQENLALTPRLCRYVSDEEDEDDYEDDEEQEEEDEEAPADDKAPPAKKAKTAPAEEQEEPEEEAEGEEDQEEPEEEFDEEAGGAEDEDDAEVVGNGTDKTKADVADAPEAAGEEEKEAVADEGDEE